MDKRLIWFEKLYDTYADAIWRHFYHRLGDHERAKELTQEVFVKTWQYVVLGKEIEYERAFLYRIAKNLFINEIRTKKSVVSLDSLAEEGFEIKDEHNVVMSAEQKELIEHLGKIKESYRTVLVLRYVDDLPVKEIANLLEEKDTTISMRIKRGIEALKQTYKKTQSS
jgi:RNA polymerase sigma-70 factor, ECF subfamily